MSLYPISAPFGWQDDELEVLQPGTVDWCAVYEVGDTLKFQVRADKVGDDLRPFDPFAPSIDGTTSGTPGANFLSDTSGTDFTVDPDPAIATGHLVWNGSEDLVTEVSGAVGATNVVIADDIFDSASTTGDSYEVVPCFPTNGLYRFDGTNDKLTILAGGAVYWADYLPAQDTLYYVEVDVEDWQSGTNVDVQFGFPLGNTVGEITGNGTFFFIGEAPSASNRRLRIVDSGADAQFTISDVRIYKATEAFHRLESNDYIIASSGSFDWRHRNFQGFEIDTTGFDEDCYQVCLHDGANLVKNGHLTDDQDDFVTIVTGGIQTWVITGGDIVHTGEALGGPDYARFDLLEPTALNCTYWVEWTHTGDEVTLFLRNSSSGATQTFAGLTSQAAGSYQVDIKANGEYDQLVLQAAEDADVTVQASGNSKEIVIRRFGGQVGAAQWASCCALVSGDICLRDTLDAKLTQVTMQFTTDNFSDGDEQLGRALYFGAGGTDDYEESVYLWVNARFARYSDEDYDDYRDSDGRVRINHSDRVRVYELQTEPSPEWLFDWLTLAMRAENFLLGTEAYYPVGGDAAPNWGRSSKLAGLTFDIAKQDQQHRRTL